jgi:hypothetical protein
VRDGRGGLGAGPSFLRLGARMYVGHHPCRIRITFFDNEFRWRFTEKSIQNIIPVAEHMKHS